ncbi:hypothetical protein B2J88_46545 [Rhodococcus sp. SRB_17]|nr:hypothetical protein [Rhodococcus sp. SRB_17]
MTREQVKKYWESLPIWVGRGRTPTRSQRDSSVVDGLKQTDGTDFVSCPASLIDMLSTLDGGTWINVTKEGN